jgi:hypothetical protein
MDGLYVVRGHDCMDAGGRTTQELKPRSPKRRLKKKKIFKTYKLAK